MLPFQASTEVHWHHPRAQASDPAARRLTAKCHLGAIRAQPAFGHIALLQALQQQMKAGYASWQPVSHISQQPSHDEEVLVCIAFKRSAPLKILRGCPIARKCLQVTCLAHGEADFHLIHTESWAYPSLWHIETESCCATGQGSPAGAG